MSSSPEPPSSTDPAETDEPVTEESTALRHTGRAGFLGAMFLMATSAIGPGFLTQTTTFTVQLGAAFAFVILVTVIVDIAIQLNVWRIIGDLRPACPGPRQPAPCQERASCSPRSTCFGGIVFNIGNIAGCSLGLEALFGLDVRVGRRHLRRRRDRGSSWSDARASRWTGS